LVEGASWRRTKGRLENKTFDESRRLGLKAGLKGWQPAQAGGKPESGAEERGRRRKLETGAIGGPEGRWKAQAGDRHEGGARNWSAAQAADEFEGRAGRLVEGASPKLAGRHSRKVDKRRKLKVGAKAKPRMQQPMRVGG